MQSDHGQCQKLILRVRLRGQDRRLADPSGSHSSAGVSPRRADAIGTVDRRSHLIDLRNIFMEPQHEGGWLHRGLARRGRGRCAGGLVVHA